LAGRKWTMPFSPECSSFFSPRSINGHSPNALKSLASVT
jgi:hypothetical protein